MRQKYLKTEMIEGQVLYSIEHPKFKAKISQHGGQLVSFMDTSSKQDWLWLSRKASLFGDRAIRGGAPICWPWFGPSSNSQLPQHGYARLLSWDLISCESDENQMMIRLSCKLDEAAIDLSHLSLVVEYILSDEITINLHTENQTDKTIQISQAIHTYFNIENISNTEVSGLGGLPFLDQLTNSKSEGERDLVIDQEVDRIYETNNAIIELNSPNGIFEISGSHFDSVVVWNPWQDKAKLMSDFDDMGYQQMICVEMANTQGLTIYPKKDFTLSQRIKRKVGSRQY